MLGDRGSGTFATPCTSGLMYYDLRRLYRGLPRPSGSTAPSPVIVVALNVSTRTRRVPLQLQKTRLLSQSERGTPLCRLAQPPLLRSGQITSHTTPQRVRLGATGGHDTPTGTRLQHRTAHTEYSGDITFTLLSVNAACAMHREGQYHVSKGWRQSDGGGVLPTGTCLVQLESR